MVLLMFFYRFLLFFFVIHIFIPIYLSILFIIFVIFLSIIIIMISFLSCIWWTTFIFAFLQQLLLTKLLNVLRNLSIFTYRSSFIFLFRFLILYLFIFFSRGPPSSPHIHDRVEISLLLFMSPLYQPLFRADKK